MDKVREHGADLHEFLAVWAAMFTEIRCMKERNSDQALLQPDHVERNDDGTKW